MIQDVLGKDNPCLI